MQAQENGYIVARYNVQGQLDTSFGQNGFLKFPRKLYGDYKLLRLVEQSPKHLLLWQKDLSKTGWEDLCSYYALEILSLDDPASVVRHAVWIPSKS